MISRIEKAIHIVNKEEVKPLLIDHGLYNGDVELQFQVGKYLVSCVNIYKDNDKRKLPIPTLKCTCDDFTGRGVNNIEGSFLCKHCLAALSFIINNPNLIAIKEHI